MFYAVFQFYLQTDRNKRFCFKPIDFPKISFQQELNIDSVNYDLKYAYFYKTVKNFKIRQR